MNLSKEKILKIQQAIGYAIIHAKTESETSEFALLKLDIDKILIIIETQEKIEIRNKMKCLYNECQVNPKCENICRYHKNGNWFDFWANYP